MDFDIDIAIVVGFLALTLAVGIYYGRGVKTISDYALGGRNFSTATLVSTIVATVVTGSSFMIVVLKTYSSGMHYLLPNLGIAFSLLISAYIFIPRMHSFLGSISIAHTLGKYYGEKVRVITAICSIIANVGAIAVQYKVFGGMVAYFLDLNPITTIVSAGVVVTLYSTFGGIRSVTFTDVLQFMVFGVVIPLIGIIIWKSTLVTENFSFSQALQNPHFSFSKVFDYKTPEFWQMTSLFFYFTIPSMFPAAFQRIVIGKNIKQVKRAFIISAIILLAIKIFIAWIGFLMLAINPDLPANKLVPYIVDNYTMTGFKGLIVAGIIAMAMSSADSFINVASVTFAHDLCKPLNITIKNELKLTRCFALLLGFGSIFLALSGKDLLGIILTANAFYLPIVTVILLITILGFRTSSKSVLSGMLAGFTTIVLCKNFINIGFDPIVPAMLVNLAFVLGVHYCFRQNGGWINTKIQDIEPPVSQIQTLNQLKKFNLVDFIKKNSPQDDKTYSLFGIFCFISTISTIYLTHSQLLGKHANILMYIYQIMLVISCIFMFYMMWSPRIKSPIIIGVIWNVALFFMLSFCSILFLFLNNYGQIELIVFTMNLMVLFNLCRWKVALTILSLGFVSALTVYKSTLGGQILNIGLKHTNLTFIYVALLASTALIIFLKPKQDYLEATEEKVETLETETVFLGHTNITLSEKVSDLKETVDYYDERDHQQQAEIDRLGATAQKILNNVNHELRLPIGNVMNFSEMLQDNLEKYDKEHLKIISKEVYQNSNRLSSMILNMLDLATLNANKLELDKKLVNLSEIVEDRVKLCRKVYLQDKSIDFKLTIQPEIMLSVDPNYFKQTIDNLVINAINFSEKGVIEITLKKDSKNVNFIISDQGKGIPPNEIYDVFTAFQEGSNTASKAQGRGVGLALCKAAIRAHNGDIEAESRKVGALIRFVIPV